MVQKFLRCHKCGRAAWFLRRAGNGEVIRCTNRICSIHYKPEARIRRTVK